MKIFFYNWRTYITIYFVVMIFMWSPFRHDPMGITFTIIACVDFVYRLWQFLKADDLKQPLIPQKGGNPMPPSWTKDSNEK